MSDSDQRTDVRELALAVDIGGSKMAVGLVDRRGTLIDRESVRTDRDKNANDLFDSLAALITRQIQRGVERHGSRIAVVGIAKGQRTGPVQRQHAGRFGLRAQRAHGQQQKKCWHDKAVAAWAQPGVPHMAKANVGPVGRPVSLEGIGGAFMRQPPGKTDRKGVKPEQAWSWTKS